MGSRLLLFQRKRWIRQSDITDIASVVLPVAPVVEKSGSFMDWQGKVDGLVSSNNSGVS